MSEYRCPFLGLLDDPHTALDFPAETNACHHASPVEAIQLDYQRAYCLDADHLRCAVYQRRELAPLPPEIAARPKAPAAAAPVRAGRDYSRFRYVPVALAVALMLIFFAAAGLARSRMAGGANPENPVPETGNGAVPDAVIPTPSLSSLDLILSTETPQPGDSGGIVVDQTQANCPMPEGWTTYTIQEGDTLLGIALGYEVTIEELQTANCLDDSDLIYEGTELYVPQP